MKKLNPILALLLAATQAHAANFIRVPAPGILGPGHPAVSPGAGTGTTPGGGTTTPPDTTPPAPTPTVQLSVNVNALDFGQVALGGTSVGQTVSVLNSGNTSTALAFALSGDTDFAVSGCDSALAAGQSCQASVSFTPHFGGARAGQLSVTGALSAAASVSLSGQGYVLPASVTSTSHRYLYASGTNRTVAITGGSFKTGATVTLGGTSGIAATLNGSDSSLNFAVPAGLAAGNYSLSVQNPGASASNTLANAVTVLPALTATSVSPSTASTAGGATITLTGANFAPAHTPVVKLGGASGASATAVTLSSATQLTANVPAHAAGAVDVYVATNDDFGNTATATVTNGVTYVSPDVVQTENFDDARNTFFTIHGTVNSDYTISTFASIGADKVSYGKMFYSRTANAWLSFTIPANATNVSLQLNDIEPNYTETISVSKLSGASTWTTLPNTSFSNHKSFAKQVVALPSAAAATTYRVYLSCTDSYYYCAVDNLQVTYTP